MVQARKFCRRWLAPLVDVQAAKILVKSEITVAIISGVLLRLILAHKRKDGITKRGLSSQESFQNSDLKRVQLPVLKAKVTWKRALRERTHQKIPDLWKDLPRTHFKRVWREMFTRILKLGRERESLGSATQLLTRNSKLNYPTPYPQRRRSA